MILGETVLLLAAVFVMSGLAKGITSRLHLNDYVAAFAIFLIILLNLRGTVQLSKEYTLSVGGVISVLLVIFTMIKRNERISDLLFALFSAFGCAGIALLYTLYYSEGSGMDPRALAALLSLPIGLWCAFTARRSFPACLFSAVCGSFLGITLYVILFRKHGNIGGNYTFAVMWLGTIFGLMIRYLLTLMMRSVKSPRANSYFEASELAEREEEKKQTEEKK